MTTSNDRLHICLHTGVNGDAVSVENLVLQIMHSAYEEGVLFEAVPSTGEIVPCASHSYFCGGWIGWHCEGSILRNLFALVMWEELFNTVVEDVFQTRFQDSPLDLYADGGLFYLNRRQLIDAKLQLVKEMTHKELIGTCGVLAYTMPCLVLI
jgi:hypothetical protein